MGYQRTRRHLLVEGNIPAHQECPFRKECDAAKRNTCNHRGKDHDVAFSCILAQWLAQFPHPVKPTEQSS